MRKGDARREELIAVAERLFYTKGYEKTSVQDIIDEMDFSKGGFYHHFDSKLAVLEAICDLRAKESCQQALDAAAKCEGSAAEQLNAVFRASEILTSGQTNFVALLIQVAYRDDGALMREKMKRSQMDCLVEIVEEIIARGAARQEFFVTDVPCCARMLLLMHLAFTDEIALLLSCEESEESAVELAVRKLNTYRAAMERILLAPFGAMELMDVRELQQLVQRVIRERLRRRADAMLSSKRD